MSLASDLLPLLDEVRGIAGSSDFGLHPHSVTLHAGTWSGTDTGEGAETTSDTNILEGGSNPKVQWLTDEQVAVGGDIAGSIEIGPLTPSHISGGHTIASLVGSALTAGQTLYVTVTGPNHPDGARYVLTKVDGQSALHYTLRAAPA